jgi:hypothetical protein
MLYKSGKTEGLNTELAFSFDYQHRYDAGSLNRESTQCDTFVPNGLWNSVGFAVALKIL